MSPTSAMGDEEGGGGSSSSSHDQLVAQPISIQPKQRGIKTEVTSLAVGPGGEGTNDSRVSTVPESEEEEEGERLDMEVDCDEEEEVDESSSGALFALCGYRHCVSEAVRFLIEEENLSPDDPIVVGLQRHLLAKEAFHLNSILDLDSEEGEEEEEEEDDEGFVAGPTQREDSDSMDALFWMTSPVTSSNKWSFNTTQERCQGESSSSSPVWVAAPISLGGQVHQSTDGPRCSPTPSI